MAAMSTRARAGLRRWRDLDAGHRGGGAAIAVGMEIGIEVLLAGLVVFTVVTALVTQPPELWLILLLSGLLVLAHLGLLATHVMSDRHRRDVLRTVAVVALVVVSVLLAAEFPYAAYLMIPLSFVYLEQFQARPATVAVVVDALGVLLVVGLRTGWTVGGVVGPLAGAAVAVIMGLSLKAMRAQAVELERLNADLLAVQGRLAASERRAGMLDERSRLAREIHDTVAQSLSSIGILLSAVERVDPDHPAIDQIRLAHRTASDALAETRGLIAELTPPTVADQGLVAALERGARTTWAVDGLEVEVQAPDLSDLPMSVQTGLLRLCQGAMSNVVRHARAHHAVIDIDRDGDALTLTVSDDGVGMDPDAPVPEGSFGLRTIRERAEELSGTVNLASGPGGTTLRVTLPTVHPGDDR